MFKWNKLMNLSIWLSISLLGQLKSYGAGFSCDWESAGYHFDMKFIGFFRTTFQWYSLLSVFIWSVNCWQVHLDCWRGKVREASIHLSTVCESRSSGNEVICRTHSTHTYYTSFTNPVHWSILRQAASHRFSLYCILLFCFVLCIVSAVDYSVWHSEAHYGIQCVNASQPVRGTMDSRQPPNSDRQTPQLCSINCNELFRNAYMACFATHWSIMHKVGENTKKKKT